MFLYYIVFLVFVIMAFRDYKKTVLIWCAARLLINGGVCLKFSYPPISMQLAVDLLLLFLYFKNRSRGLNNEKFPLALPFYIIFFSYLVSSILGVVAFEHSFLIVTKTFIQEYLLIFLIWTSLRTKNDIKFLLKSYVIVFFVLCLYGVFERATEFNPILAFETSLIPKGLNTGRIYYLGFDDEVIRRNDIIRCSSFFGISIAFGCACVLFLSPLLYFKNKFGQYLLLTNKYFYGLTILLFLGIFFSNSRSPLIAIPVFLLAAIKFKYLFSTRIAFLVTFVLLALFQFIEPYVNNINSLFDKSSENVGGSSLAMREGQIARGILLFQESPIYGNGIDSVRQIFVKEYSDLFGAESIWIPLLADRGAIGLFSYLFLFWFVLQLFRKSQYSKFIFWYSVGYVLLESVTGAQDIVLFFSIILIVYRIDYLEKITNKILL